MLGLGQRVRGYSFDLLIEAKSNIPKNDQVVPSSRIGKSYTKKFIQLNKNALLTIEVFLLLLIRAIKNMGQKHTWFSEKEIKAV
ncbi:hypothetical protein DDT91_17045 [Algoriphagus sp. AK58]|nr:hypothetical protein [Algoriphagus sp. AK58]